MALQQTQQEMNENGCSNYEYDDENPEPTWNLPNWKGNASAPSVCGGCITRITRTGEIRGCEQCDEVWDMPDLENPIQAWINEAPNNVDDGIVQNETNYCEGCELLKAGLGGENQMGHACMGY